MSWEWTQRVWSLGRQTSPSQRLILLALAQHADATGQCWPSQGRLAGMTGLARETVNRQVLSLRAAGLVEVTGRGRGILYRLRLPTCDVGSQVEGATCDAGSQGCDGGSQDPVTLRHTNLSVEPVNEPLSPPAETRGTAEASPLRKSGGERGSLGQDGQTTATATERMAEAAQLPLWGSASEHVEAVLAGLEARDRGEVTAVLRAWLGQEHGARAVATWARQAAAWPPGRLASKACPRAYVEACMARVARQAAEEAAREAATRAREEVRQREAAREEAEQAEAKGRRREEEERLRAAFRALEPAEREAVVAEAMGRMDPRLRRAIGGVDPMESAFVGSHVREVMRGRAEG